MLDPGVVAHVAVVIFSAHAGSDEIIWIAIDVDKPAFGIELQQQVGKVGYSVVGLHKDLSIANTSKYQLVPEVTQHRQGSILIKLLHGIIEGELKKFGSRFMESIHSGGEL